MLHPNTSDRHCVNLSLGTTARPLGLHLTPPNPRTQLDLLDARQLYTIVNLRNPVRERLGPRPHPQSKRSKDSDQAQLTTRSLTCLRILRSSKSVRSRNHTLG